MPNNHDLFERRPLEISIVTCASESSFFITLVLKPTACLLYRLGSKSVRMLLEVGPLPLSMVFNLFRLPSPHLSPLLHHIWVLRLLCAEKERERESIRAHPSSALTPPPHQTINRSLDRAFICAFAVGSEDKAVISHFLELFMKHHLFLSLSITNSHRERVSCQKVLRHRPSALSPLSFTSL